MSKKKKTKRTKGERKAANKARRDSSKNPIKPRRR